MLARCRRLPLTAALGVAAIPLSVHGHHHRSTERAVQAAPMGASSRLRILVDPVSPRAGQPVRLLISAAPAGASDYRGDVTSPGAYTVDSGAVPATTAAFPTAGPHPVAVEVQTPAGVEHAQ